MPTFLRMKHNRRGLTSAAGKALPAGPNSRSPNLLAPRATKRGVDFVRHRMPTSSSWPVQQMLKLYISEGRSAEGRPDRRA
jgi:hypothetical protein